MNANASHSNRPRIVACNNEKYQCSFHNRLKYNTLDKHASESMKSPDVQPCMHQVFDFICVAYHSLMVVNAWWVVHAAKGSVVRSKMQRSSKSGWRKHERLESVHTYSQSHIDVICVQVVPLLEGFTDHPETSLHVRINLQQSNRGVSLPKPAWAAPGLGMNAGDCMCPLPCWVGMHKQTGTVGLKLDSALWLALDIHLALTAVHWQD